MFKLLMNAHMGEDVGIACVWYGMVWYGMVAGVCVCMPCEAPRRNC